MVIYVLFIREYRIINQTKIDSLIAWLTRYAGPFIMMPRYFSVKLKREHVLMRDHLRKHDELNAMREKEP